MASLSDSVDASLACPSGSDLQVDMSSSALALLASPELSSASPTDLSSAATTALHLERYASELLLWLRERQRQSAAALAADDALFFFETRHPELLDDLPLLFAWLALFLGQLETHEMHAAATAGRAVQQLESGRDAAALADELQLQSSLTLLFWKHEAERQLQASAESAPEQDRAPIIRTVFRGQKELLQWLVDRKDLPITKQDVINHVLEEHPVFAASKSAAALKIWTTRFLKKHLPPYTPATKTETTTTETMTVASEAASSTAASATRMSDAVEAEIVAVETRNDPPTPSGTEDVGSVVEMCDPQLSMQLESNEVAPSTEEAASPAKHCGKRRSCPGGYMLFSNEFKLHALQKLDEGKSVTEVAQELGLKNPKRLSYWKSVRDKLATSEKKRFRLAGGGRRSSCSFEDELLTWVSERHQRGEGTDVKAVLEYMREFHPSFTAGKKEATLRKWILRFFKRCWRAPSTSMDSQDAEKSYIFV